MTTGRLSNYFEGIAAKRLSAVEVDLERSNQHEFDGVNGLRRILGSERAKFPAKFIYMGDDEIETVIEYGSVTWYDAREQHPTRSEYRLYYPKTAVSDRMNEHDLLVIGKLSDGSVMVIIVRVGTTFEHKILWLFGLHEDGITGNFFIQEIGEEGDSELDYPTRVILTELGLEISEVDNRYLDIMLQQFGSQFPSTQVFSSFARETIPEVSSLDNPDPALLAWVDRDELLFRTIERYLVGEQIDAGFRDVDHFISFSLSVQNRRKSRAGFSLENHTEKIFTDHGITYTRGGITENNSKPDFIFPGIQQYHEENFQVTRLTMLGTKSTCKDRWRQVLSEANRISEKHLLTLEPSISENQTNEMMDRKLQLVLPKQLHSTYTASQQNWLMNVQSFMNLILLRQSS